MISDTHNINPAGQLPKTLYSLGDLLQQQQLQTAQAHVMGTSPARYALLVMALVLSCTRVQAGEPDGYLGPRPVRPGAETLAPRDFRQFMQASRAAGVSTSTDWTSLLLGSYLTNAQLGQWAADYATRCSSIARKFSIGTSVNGADLFVVEISNNRGQVEAKPNFRYVSAGWLATQHEGPACAPAWQRGRGCLCLRQTERLRHGWWPKQWCMQSGGGCAKGLSCSAQTPLNSCMMR